MQPPTPLSAKSLHPDTWHRPGHGPRYRQLARHLAETLQNLSAGTPLPPERSLAQMAGVSRVTLRRTMAELSAMGLISARAGSGSFVASPPARFAHSLSALASFTQTLRARGISSSSVVLQAGLFAPSQAETALLGLAPEHRVARVQRLRLGDGVPVALETSSLPQDVLPAPQDVAQSLYDVLDARGMAPARAVQRVSAVSATKDLANRLGVADGAALLRIERTGFLQSGRAVEFTSGVYRSEVVDFVSELRRSDDSPG